MIKNIEFSDIDFKLFQELILKEAGIYIDFKAKSILKNKFVKILRTMELDSFSDYYKMILNDKIKMSEMLNSVTTNETYFFREPKQFQSFEHNIIPIYAGANIKVWSAASSTGSEAYTISMILKNNQASFSILASDINNDVIEYAKKGSYPLSWLSKIPLDYQKKYGIKQDSTTFQISNILKANTKFEVRNLMKYQGDIGTFDVIFLRNVLIYFQADNRKIIIKNILKNLNIGGFLIISTTECIKELNIENLQQVDMSIFRRIK